MLKIKKLANCSLKLARKSKNKKNGRELDFQKVSENEKNQPKLPPSLIAKTSGITKFKTQFAPVSVRYKRNFFEKIL
ncbi:hypothetical protein [Helicobacter pylori]|uniref:hypothetical protein n=1 Tax=Helicobacter pylori TaxID=210 RepID=UPI00165B584B|nr:hypothetical protein [Helicobacter pylori]